MWKKDEERGPWDIFLVLASCGVWFVFFVCVWLCVTSGDLDGSLLVALPEAAKEYSCTLSPINH